MSLQHARKRQLVHTGTHNRKVITKLSWQGKIVTNTSRESVWANVFFVFVMCYCYPCGSTCSSCWIAKDIHVTFKWQNLLIVLIVLALLL